MARSAQSRKLEERLARIPASVRKAVGPALDSSAEQLVKTMRSLAPDDPNTPAPDLKTSIKFRDGSHDLQRTVFTNDPVARWQEFGAVKMAPSPFFFPAYRLLKKRLASRIKRAVGKAVREAK